MKKLMLLSFVLSAAAVTPSLALPLIEFSPDPSTAGNWSYDGMTGLLSFEQDVVVDRAVGSNSDGVVAAHVYVPTLKVSGSDGLYSLTPIGNTEIKVTNGNGSKVYMSGTLNEGYLNTIGTIGAGYSQFSTDITNVVVTAEGQALGSAALDILAMAMNPGPASLDFELALQGGSSANYRSFAAMIDGGFSGGSGFSGAMSVPEPTTIALFGLGSLVLARRRRKMQTI